MRVAIYARVSTSEQDAELQLVELRRYVTARGWDVAGEFVDHIRYKSECALIGTGFVKRSLVLLLARLPDPKCPVPVKSGDR